MGKHGKKKKSPAPIIDGDELVFMERAQELKEEGNHKFQSKEYAVAIELYEKALKLLPRSHHDAVFLHTNIAQCVLLMEQPVDYERVVAECTMALQINPGHKKALLRRGKALEEMGHIHLALMDVDSVLISDPQDKAALQAASRLRSIRHSLADEEEEHDKEALIEAKCRKLKLIFHEDIRLAEMPVNCNLTQLRDIIRQRYPTSSKGMLIKYRDTEGDLITITNDDELRLALSSVDSQEFFRLHLVHVDPDQDPLFHHLSINQEKAGENGDTKSEMDVDKWVYEFMQLFKNHLGIDPEGHVDMQEVGMDFCVKALEDVATSQDAQSLFEMAESKFEEIAALALFNLGNVHMCAATKRISVKDDATKEELLSQLRDAYSWAQQEYDKAGKRYEEALWIKPDFYEGLLALGQQLFESAKLRWSLTLATNTDYRDVLDSSVTLELFDAAEEKVQSGIEMWEILEEQRIRELMDKKKKKSRGGAIVENGDSKDKPSIADVVEHAAVMRSQINLFWGNVLFERSHVEYKLGIPEWKDRLDSAVSRFKQAGASPTDIAVVVKNHASNSDSQESLGFKIDEIVQAWNEMCEAKRFVKKWSSFRVEPLLRRKVPRLHQILEHH